MRDLGVEPLSPALTPEYLARARRKRPSTSRRSSPISASSPASATSTSARRCFARASRRCAPRRPSPPRPAARRSAPAASSRRSAPCSPTRLRPAAPPCATIAAPMGNSASFSTRSPSMIARVCRARALAAAASCAASCRRGARPSTARSASARARRCCCEDELLRRPGALPAGVHAASRPRISIAHPPARRCDLPPSRCAARELAPEHEIDEPDTTAAACTAVRAISTSSARGVRHSPGATPACSRR